MEREASFYEKRDDGRVQCHLCPHNCIIAEGKTGICRVRVNRGNVLYTAIYGEVSSIAIISLLIEGCFPFHVNLPITT